ncbi:hypothetical protein BDR04DRAFT_1229922 [Suillus decipiens]|nr:hypothetical protein BDR04DRAFT_1229922 [Suillus decipiens]
MSFFTSTSTSTSTSTPTSTDDTSCPHGNFVGCGGLLATILLAVLLFPCYTVALWGALRALCTALFGRALNVQIESMEDDKVHGGRKLIPLVFCGTWMRPPSPIQEAASVDQSEWSSVQPLSVLASSQVACKSVPGMGMSESVVSADVSTRHFPNDAKSFSPIQTSPQAVMVAMMIQMPSPILRCWKDRKDPSYNPARPDHAPSEYQIGVAQVQYVDTRC